MSKRSSNKQQRSITAFSTTGGHSHKEEDSIRKIIRPELIKGCDDMGNFYGCHAELAAVQNENRDAWYAANALWWNQEVSGGYGGKTDDEAMIGDKGGEADGEEGLAFLDRLLRLDYRHSSSPSSSSSLGFRRAVDAGAGVGRVTKNILLKRYDSVHLVEADPGWSKQSRKYLGQKRSARCTFTCARLEDLDATMIEGWGDTGANLVWLQWTLQYLTDSDAIDTLRNLASGLIDWTGILVVKENRPYGVARKDRFQLETPDGGCGEDVGGGRYDITRSDDHHRLLFERAGLVVILSEEGIETNTYALQVATKNCK
jgi:hypothetical protein